MIERHRGPFTLLTHVLGRGYRILAGAVTPQQALGMAQQLVNNPDVASGIVSIWSDSEHQWISAVHRGGSECYLVPVYRELQATIWKSGTKSSGTAQSSGKARARKGKSSRRDRQSGA